MKKNVFELKFIMELSLNGSFNIFLNMNIKSGESSDLVFKRVKRICN